MAKAISSIPSLTNVERNALTGVPSGTIILNTDNNQFERWNGTIWGPQVGNGISSAFASFASAQVTTDSASVSSGYPTFTTFSNSPAFIFTPAISGIYKVYCNIPCDSQGTSAQGITRIFNTSGGATLLQESQANVGAGGTSFIVANGFVQSTYSLNAGTTYQFDIQGSLAAGSDLLATGSNSPFYMFAEGISLSPVLASPIGVVATKFGVDPTTAGTLSTTSGSPIVFPYIYYDTTSSYNAGTGQYIAPVSGYYDLSLTGIGSSANYDIEIWVNGVNVSGSIIHWSGGNAASSPYQVYLSYQDVLTVVIDNSAGLDYSALSGISGITPQVAISLRPPTPAVVSRMVQSTSTSTGTVISVNSPAALLDLSSNPLTAPVSCIGGDVEVGLQDDGSGQAGSLDYICVSTTNAWPNVHVLFYRDGTLISHQKQLTGANTNYNHGAASPSSFKFIDKAPPPGAHTYTVQAYVACDDGGTPSGVAYYVQLYARPLA